MAEPKVRFKQDDGSSYPEWITGKLGDITDKVDRKAPAGSVAPIMMVSQGNGFIYQADKYSRENAGQSLKNYTLLQQGEFAYNHGASKAKPYGVAYCLKEEREARVPFVYHTFRITKGINSYWHEALNTRRMDRKLKRMVSSGARMDGLLNINYDTYMDVDVSIPCEEEQQKIANFLSSIDEVIAASEQEVANLETQKKAVMKKIFSQEVRFKREDGTDFPEWEEVRFGDTVLIERGGSPRPIEQYLTEGEGLNWIKIGDAPQHGNYITQTAQRIIPEGLRKTRQVFVGDLILSNSMSFGKPYIMGIDGCIHDGWLLIRNYQNRYNLIYLCFLLGSDYMLKQYKSLAGGSAVNNLNKDLVAGTTVFIPCIEEQRLIADFLSSFDEAIAAAKKELELWKELKKGLLQQMFV